MLVKSTNQRLLGYGVAIAGVALTVLFFRLIDAGSNITTVAFSFLLVVQISASLGGLGPGILASLAGTLCFNFFFIPPVGTFHIEDPQNWVALSAFLITAIIASQLSSAARARAADAEKRREMVWRLFQLSQAIIATPDFKTAIASIPRQVVEIFNARYCAIFQPDEHQSLEPLAVSGNASDAVSRARLGTIEKVFRDREAIILEELKTPAGKNGQEQTYVTICLPLKVGVRPTGVMVLSSTLIEQGAIEAIAGLVALALERARFLREVSHTEAIKQSDKLKSALLASVSHSLRTPLTAIRTSIDSLLRDDCQWDEQALREFHLIISEETFRLTRLVTNLLEMARIEAGELHPQKQWSAVSEIFNNAIERCDAVLRDHKVVIELDEALPAVNVDSRLLAEVLTNLVENAAKYSGAGTTITVSGRIEAGQLVISVSDEGAGIAPTELDRVFDKFYRSQPNAKNRIQGTGMGLAIARGIVEAHNGRIWAESKIGQGSTFTFTIPAEYKNISELLPVDGELYS